jgi:hypothetical protein
VDLGGCLGWLLGSLFDVRGCELMMVKRNEHWTSGFYSWRGMMRGVDHGYVRGLMRVGFVH